MLSGLMPGISKPMVLMIFRVLASITDTVPPTSDVTQSCDPSAVNSAKRGRVPTSTLSTISKLLVSMKCAMLEVSDVAIRILPSGLMPTPSGSTPTGTSASTSRVSRSITVTRLSSSLAM